MSAAVNIRMETVRNAFQGVAHRVTVALRTQVGDAQQLEAVRDEVVYLLQSAQDVSCFTFKLHIWLIPLQRWSIRFV